jgi:large subunit ribosomal protein L15
MKYHELQVKSASQPKRAGRGTASGQGKTAGRGTKGQGSRTGSSRRPGFEGGQNPLMQRFPKLRGFRSHKSEVTEVTTGQLNALKVKTVDNFALAEAGLVPNAYGSVKLLFGGQELKSAKSIKLQFSSNAAISAVEKAGGSFEPTPRVGREKQAKAAKK